MVGTLTGYVFLHGETDLTLTFSKTLVGIGGIGTTATYFVRSPQYINSGMTTLNGRVAGFPEPSAEFLLGIGALGLMGLVTASRKLIST